jgi:hypothetical protein
MVGEPAAGPIWGPAAAARLADGGLCRDANGRLGQGVELAHGPLHRGLGLR